MSPTLQQVRTPKIIRPEHAFGYNKVSYRQAAMGDDGNEPDPLHVQNKDLAVRMWHAIQQVYPGSPILTGANYAQGICTIEVPLFTPQPYVIHIRNLHADPMLKRVVKAAGEILERYRIPRSGFKVEHWITAMQRFKPTHRLADKPPE